LAQRFCSCRCKVRAQTTGRNPPKPCNKKARQAQSLLRYHVIAGRIRPPDVCEQCGSGGRRLEAAHFNYDEPLRVRWLCVPCHRRWDHAVPKGGVG
jgi:hypothetical protein